MPKSCAGRPSGAQPARTKALKNNSQTSVWLANKPWPADPARHTASAEVARLTATMDPALGCHSYAPLAKREKQAEEDKIAIANLGKALNSARQTIQELRRFRSEFFGRLRDVLEGRSDVKIVGDRFVFQSEVLLPRVRPVSAKRDRNSWHKSPPP